ncbi:SIR2 family NAD-dependent protein deacylase [Cytophaga hutchinsonii]|uniref:NAD-dependent protein deacylase n=1 Tax=Cytophaga hutchinsonii (strain ATCC 33406 / DSM 1761 / CIP 103989 / NBRC 15051 / NCIMB 9469 / D465) TaxID=269798 RepID=A0A6N4ST15_CYTH3|nr:NAD-dependent deacylase [Cytophaga hutchinsonii]ABG59603.1 NAD-dependent deacetylase [Cytophaga hutchinsonii ATCC 33406]SFX67373.1 NAD-dependent deacetylase [Cytophaga hutchinsonii ATCC 33406]
MKNVVVLTGAGISAESGINTFRDSGGLWEGHDVMEVASPEGWRKNPELVLEFYNIRRKDALKAQPNEAHLALVELNKHFPVKIITQNVDDLHERAGSTDVLHLHGKLFESRSTANHRLIYPIDGWELKPGDRCTRGSQLRPNIVWFGEAVPLMDDAVKLTAKADVFIVIGTSLQVYPAASLVDYAGPDTEVIVIDPNMPAVKNHPLLTLVAEKASIATPRIVRELIEKYK